VWIELVCSGTLDAVAVRLAERIAVDPAIPPQGRLTTDQVERLDRAYEAFCTAVATPTAVEQELNRHTLDWLVVGWQFLACEDEDRIREAALCVRQDAIDLGEVARIAGIGVERRLDCVEELPAELYPHLLAAPVGTLLGPVHADHRYVVAEVLKRRAPSADDPDALERGRAAVVARAVRRALTERVSWHEQ
jgi:hypothetical protein